MQIMRIPPGNMSQITQENRENIGPERSTSWSGKRSYRSSVPGADACNGRKPEPVDITVVTVVNYSARCWKAYNTVYRVQVSVLFCAATAAVVCSLAGCDLPALISGFQDFSVASLASDYQLYKVLTANRTYDTRYLEG